MKFKMVYPNIKTLLMISDDDIVTLDEALNVETLKIV